MKVSLSPSELDTPRGQLTRVGEYHLGETLGHGTFGHVRAATHLRTGKKMACKILPALLQHSDVDRGSSHNQAAADAHKEIILLKALCGAKIPGVVEIEGVMHEEGWTYVFLKQYTRCLGGKKDDPKGQKQVVLFFQQLLRTVEALHNLGVTHEDLKRSNVLIDDSGGKLRPVLADFGFAQFVPHVTSLSPYDGDLVRSIGGTLDYSSPEKALDLKYNPFASDVWSLGIILLRMLDKGNPYRRAGESSKIMRQRLLDNDAEWEWLEEDCHPGGLKSLIDGMLHRNPAKRLTVLDHPFMGGPRDKCNAPVNLPARHLGLKVPRPLPDRVLDDLTFISSLADLSDTFSEEKIRPWIQSVLVSNLQCWEKQWATMLWTYEEYRDLCDWADMLPNELAKTEISPRVRSPRRNKGLRPIHLSPVDIPPKLPRHMREVPPLDLPPSTVDQENTPPAHKVLTIAPGVTAAVGGPVRKLRGPNAFGVARSAARKSAMTISPNKVQEAPVAATVTYAPKTRPALGKPVRTRPPLVAKKVITPTAEKRVTPTPERRRNAARTLTFAQKKAVVAPETA